MDSRFRGKDENLRLFPAGLAWAGPAVALIRPALRRLAGWIIAAAAGKQLVDGLREPHDRDRFRYISLRSRGADALLVAAGRIGCHRHDRHVGELLVSADHADEVEPADVWKLDV